MDLKDLYILLNKILQNNLDGDFRNIILQVVYWYVNSLSLQINFILKNKKLHVVNFRKFILCLELIK